VADSDQLRYSRQVLFAGIGEQGQARIGASTVVVAGCGALGSFLSSALVRAGIGRLRIIDRDYVELSNLQRQWLFTERDVEDGIPKAVAAARELARANSSVEIEPVVADLTPANAGELLASADLILDGTDNFETRYLVNDYAVMEGIPWVYGGAVASYGITMPVIPGRTCCLACIYPNPPEGTQPTCETAGVLNAVTGLIASIQAADALKILARGPDQVRARITTVDVWEGTLRQIDQPSPVKDCAACGRREFIHLESSRRGPVSLCGRNAVQLHDERRSIDLVALRLRLEPLGDVRANEFALRFSTGSHEMTIFPDGRAIIKGTQDVGVARSLYARYVGV